MKPLKITDYTLTSALGAGLEAQLTALRGARSGLTPCTFDKATALSTWVGEVQGADDIALPDTLARFDCRNNRLAVQALRRDGFEAAARGAIERFGAHRVGLFLGTSTSGILQSELAYRELTGEPAALPDWYDYQGTHNMFSLTALVQQYLGLAGVASAISTACSSSAKVFASAQRAIATGLCDAAIVGGVDSLCLTTLFGFHALQLVGQDICRPSDSRRQGLSIGEAAGFALLQSEGTAEAPLLLGYGESSDAHHMSAPHPEGLGARTAMQAALDRAGLAAADIDYINLHGTGTPANDVAESIAVTGLFGTTTPCSSTKGFTGHTLGAAGIAEAVFCLLALEHGLMPGTLNTRQVDPGIHCRVLLDNERRDLRCALSNSFGFGGSNCSLVLGRGSAA